MTKALWYPAAARDDGPSNKVSGSLQPKHGAVYHSMQGSWAGSRSQLFGPLQRSWQLSVLRSGFVLQHYAVTAWCWQSGDRDDPLGHEHSNNRDLIGIEHEGGPPDNLSEPLTEAQLEASARLTAWLVAEGHIPNLSRSGPSRSLWEHNEIVATSCPSGRIPWLRLGARTEQLLIPEQEEDMRAILIKSAQSPDVFAWSGTKIAKLPSMTHVAAGLLSGLYLPLSDPGSIRAVPQSFIQGLLETQAER